MAIVEVDFLFTAIFHSYSLQELVLFTVVLFQHILSALSLKYIWRKFCLVARIGIIDICSYLKSYNLLTILCFAMMAHGSCRFFVTIWTVVKFVRDAYELLSLGCIDWDRNLVHSGQPLGKLIGSVSSLVVSHMMVGHISIKGSFGTHQFEACVTSASHPVVDQRTNMLCSGGFGVAMGLRGVTFNAEACAMVFYILLLGFLGRIFSLIRVTHKVLFTGFHYLEQALNQIRLRCLVRVLRMPTERVLHRVLFIEARNDWMISQWIAAKKSEHFNQWTSTRRCS